MSLNMPLEMTDKSEAITPPVKCSFCEKENVVELYSKIDVSVKQNPLVTHTIPDCQLIRCNYCKYITGHESALVKVADKIKKHPGVRLGAECARDIAQFFIDFNIQVQKP